MTPAALPAERAEAVRSLALALGFDRVGIAAAEPGPDTERFSDWVERGFAGAMDYLTRSRADRTDPARVLAGVRSVVCVALAYAPPAQGGAAPGRGEGADGPAEVARYARGDDYHDVVLDRLRALESALEPLAGEPVRTRGYVDTGPVLERVFAARAGLGWQGKNTCLIDPDLGSYLFLGVVLTDLDLAPDVPVPDRCGTCRACLDACPTAAFPEPYVLDARRCIAYTTIEDPGPIPEPLRAGHGTRVFGCDLCQEVCPWNRPHARGRTADPLGLYERLSPRPDWTEPSLAWLLDLDEAEWRRATVRSPIRRAKYRGLLRSALVAAGNRRDEALRSRLERHAGGADPMLSEHARWALARLDDRLGLSER